MVDLGGIGRVLPNSKEVKEVSDTVQDDGDSVGAVAFGGGAEPVALQ